MVAVLIAVKTNLALFVKRVTHSPATMVTGMSFSFYLTYAQIQKDSRELGNGGIIHRLMRLVKSKESGVWSTR